MKKAIFLLILIISIYSCGDNQIIIEIKPPFDGATKGVLYIGDKNFKVTPNKELNIDIKPGKYKLSFESEDDIYGYISSVSLNNDEKTTLTLNHNRRFRKIAHLIPSLKNFNCYLYNDYNFYIVDNNKTYSLIGHTNNNTKLEDIDLDSCINLKGEFLINKKEILFIKDNHIDKIVTNKEFKDILYLKSDENYIIANIENDEITFLILDLDKKMVNLPITATILGFKNKNVNLLYKDNKIILWQNGKLYHLTNNVLTLYHDFNKEGKIFMIDDELFLFSKKKIFKIKDKAINDLNLNIPLDNYKIINLKNSLLILPEHIKNGIEYYIFNKMKLDSFTVKNSMINVKNFDFIQMDRYQYLFFNKKSFDDITHSNFFLFSSF